MIWPWPDLTGGQIFKFTFQCQKVHVSNRLDEAKTMVSFYSRISHIKKVINEKPSPCKRPFFIWWPLEPKLLTLGQTWSDNYRSIRRAPQWLIRILLSYHTYGDNSDCLRKIAIFSKFDLWRPLVTSILTWPENDLSKSLRSRRGLSYAVCCLSLSSVAFEFGFRPPPETGPFRARPK